MTIFQIGLIAEIATGFFGVLAYIRLMEKKLDFYLIEHEMLMRDYAVRMNIPMRELPTRTGGLKP